MKKCKRQKIELSEGFYHLNMVACEPQSATDKLYLLSPTDEDKPSLYLFSWEKTGKGPNNDHLHLEAKILLLEADLKKLKQVGQSNFKNVFR